MNHEQDYLRFQEYLAQKRQNVSPGLGHFATNLLLAPVGFGVVEASEPKRISNEFLSAQPDYSIELGALTVRNSIAVKHEVPVNDLDRLSRGYGLAA